LAEVRPGLDAALARYAEHRGICLDYEDVWGQRHAASGKCVRAILAAMDAAGPAPAAPPALVIREGEAISLPDGGEWRLVEEDGRVRSGDDRLPPDLPLGYHRLEYLEDRAPARRRLIVCPARAFLPPGLAAGARWWGGALQLYGLRSANNWGIGDFGDLRRCAALWGAAGAAFLGTNPLHALSPAEPWRASPYSPASRCFHNPLYLEIEAIEEFRGAPCIDAQLADELRTLREAPFVDYPGVAAAKHRVLALLHQRFLEHGDTPRARAFASFRGMRGGALRDFAVFAALQEHMLTAGYGAAWQGWPAEYQSPASAAVSRFAAATGPRISYFEYLQWLCDEQLARAQQACLAHGMPIGLYADLAVSIDPGGAEAWARQSCYAAGVSVGAPPDEYNREGQNWGLPPLVPGRLAAEGYAPFIDTLRANMAHAGALRMDHVMGLSRLYWVPDGHDPADGAYVRYPFADLLGVLALESVRQRCMVIGEDLGTVPAEVREALAEAGVLSCRLLIFERDKAGDFLPSASYPRLSLAACSTHDLPTVAGWWGSTAPARQREQAALARALEREGENGTDRALAMHGFLARSPAALMSVQLEDVIGVPDQANRPGTADERPNWRRKLPLALEDWAGDSRFARTAAAVSAARAPQAAAPAPLAGAIIPRATYRLQLHRGFTFRDALALLPYLDELGISHVYCSPYLRSRTGSMHGYDVIDHRSLDPEIGTAADYAEFVAALHARGMRQIMDVVPNHMAVGPDNAWWMDVLENGPASAYAGYFDIDWQPASASLENRVLLPVLEDHYGNVLESGAFILAFDRAAGALHVACGRQRFPLDPRQYVRVLDRAFALVDAAVPAPARSEFAAIVASLLALPPRESRTQAHYATIGAAKERLAQLAKARPAVADAIDRAAQSFAGREGEPASFDALHALLEAQAWRLAYWRVASDEINYRRFFDINDLAALRMESDAAFDATHAFVGTLLKSGAVDGLRIDHPDGLFDPQAYFLRLQALAGRPVYVVIEKILGRREHIPSTWAIHGLTGYRFAAVVNGLYVDQAAEGALTRTFRSFTGIGDSFEEIAYRAKRLVLLTAMASELTVLANRLARIAQADRGTRDYTLNTLRLALATVIASFPVYRTYIADEPSAQDRRHIERAIASAARRSRAGDLSIYEFIGRALLGEAAPHASAAVRHFARKFQQLTAPVMAKGMEDTAFYIYNRLVSLNDVGADPAAFGCSIAEMHTANADRAARWPHSMLATSTHDNKRSEDVRARINVISELPAAWRLQLRRWSGMNRQHKREVDGAPAPSANDEYLLYQTLLGSWPVDGREAADETYRGRIEAYMLKAIREAKVETSWLNSNAGYEDAVREFVRVLLAPGSAFADEMRAAVQVIAPPALLAGLSKLLIKMTAPGVPDCYQGNELPDFSLVDPDNRRPVDYALRRRVLDEVKALWAAGGAPSLLRSLADGRAKLFVLWRLLALRREQETLFREARYIPLDTTGPRAGNLFCFARVHGRRAVITIAGRLFAGLVADGADLAAGWEGTRVETPLLPDGAQLVNVLTGERYAVARGCLEAPAILAGFPGAVLYCEDTSAANTASTETAAADAPA
jgi:(1->4)-alpha-D-glucan 1-alpha-D-glucosylmutase